MKRKVDAFTLAHMLNSLQHWSNLAPEEATIYRHENQRFVEFFKDGRRIPFRGPIAWTPEALEGAIDAAISAALAIGGWDYSITRRDEDEIICTITRLGDEDITAVERTGTLAMLAAYLEHLERERNEANDSPRVVPRAVLARLTRAMERMANAYRHDLIGADSRPIGDYGRAYAAAVEALGSNE